MDHQAHNPRWGFLPDERTLVGNDRQAAFLDAVKRWAPDQMHLVVPYLLPSLIPGVPNRNQGVRAVPGSMIVRDGKLAPANTATVIHHRDIGLMRAECGYFIDHLVLGARNASAVAPILSAGFGGSRCLTRVAFQQWEQLTAPLAERPIELKLAREGFVRGLDLAAEALTAPIRGERNGQARFLAAATFLLLGSKLFGGAVRSEVEAFRTALGRVALDRPGAFALQRDLASAVSYAGNGDAYAHLNSDPKRARQEATLIGLFAQRGLIVPFTDSGLCTGDFAALGDDPLMRAEATLGYVRVCLAKIDTYWPLPLRAMLLTWCKAACDIGGLAPDSSTLAPLHKSFCQIGRPRIAEWMKDCREFEKFYSELHLAQEGHLGPKARPFRLRWKWPGFAEALFHVPAVA